MNRYRSMRFGLALLPLLVFTSCEAGDEPDVDFRSYGGDGDIMIFEHPKKAEDDPIWHLHGPGVYSGHSQNDALIMKVDDHTIRDEHDNVLCTREGDALIHRIREGNNGPILYTVVDRLVFAGEPQVGDDPIYRFQGRHVLQGKNGPPLVSANTHIHFGQSMRKLVVVALIEAECGGTGL